MPLGGSPCGRERPAQLAPRRARVRLHGEGAPLRQQVGELKRSLQLLRVSDADVEQCVEKAELVALVKSAAALERKS